MVHRITGRPHLAAVAIIVAATLLVTWRHLIEGGLFLDDWWVAAEARFGLGTERQSYFGLFDGLSEITGYRPVSVPYFALIVELADLHPRVWAAVPVALTTVLGLVTYGALRAARIEWLVAVGAAVLLVTLPFSAVTKYWASGAQITVALILVLAGWWVAARGMRGHGGRPAAIGALALLAAAALTYEVVAGLVPLGIAYYASTLGGSWGRALRRTLLDVMVVAVALVLGRLGGRTDAAPTELWADHARAFVRESWWLGTGGAVPDGGWGLAFQAIIAGGVLWLAFRLVRHRGATLDAARAALRGPLALYGALMVAGVVGVLAGYAILVPADPWYHPSQPGQGGRVNTVASLGYAVGYSGLALAVATVLTLGLHARFAWARGALAAVLLALLTASFAGQSREQEGRYVQAWEIAESITDGLRATFPDGPPAGSTVLTFGQPGYVGQNIPAFGETWDLNGAVQLVFDDGSLKGFPVIEGQVVECSPVAVELPLNAARPPLYGDSYTVPYGSVVFADPGRREGWRITSQRGCTRALASLSPGPYYAAEPNIAASTVVDRPPNTKSLP